MKKPTCVIILDPKRDYADLPRTLGGRWRLLSVHDDGVRFGIGLDGVPPGPWINTVCTLFCARAGLIAAWTCLASMIRWLLAVLNPNPGEKLRWPDFRMLLELARRAPLDLWASKPEYEKSLLNALEAVVESTGNLSCTSSGFDANEVIRNGACVVIDISNLAPPWVRLFLVDLIVSQILFYRIHHHRKVDATEVVLVIDEADPLASRLSDRAFPDGSSPLAVCLAQGREYGITVVLGIRILGAASRFILNSAHYHFLFNMADAESVAEAVRAVMAPEGSERMLPDLKPGECIVRASQSGWSRAVLGRIDYVAPHRGALPAYDVYPFVPSQPIEEQPDLLKALEKKVDEHRRNKARQAKASGPVLQKHARALLDLLTLYLYEPLARLWTRMGDVSPAVQAQARKQLADHGLADFEAIRMERTSMWLGLPTEPGYRFLDKPPPAKLLRGGTAHRHFVEWIARCGRRRGYRVETEWIVPDGERSHPVDVMWVHRGRHAFEVDLGCRGTNLVSHLRACLIESTAVAAVTIVAAQKRTLDQLRVLVEAEDSLKPFRERIKYETITRFYRELWP